VRVGCAPLYTDGPETCRALELNHATGLRRQVSPTEKWRGFLEASLLGFIFWLSGRCGHAYQASPFFAQTRITPQDCSGRFNIVQRTRP
jgi:hypothetical protein